jgi:hypothetical protein
LLGHLIHEITAWKTNTAWKTHTQIFNGWKTPEVRQVYRMAAPMMVQITRNHSSYYYEKKDEVFMKDEVFAQKDEVFRT